MVKLLLLLTLYALPCCGQVQPQVVPKPTSVRQPQAKCEPCNAKDEEGYWSKAFKPDVFPVWIGSVAALLASVGGLIALYFINKQTKLAVTSAKIAEQSLVATFRPKLIVRSVSIKERKGDNYGQLWEVNFTVTNTGGSEAKITRLVAGCCLMKDVRLPAVPPYQELLDVLPQMPLEPGHHQEFNIETPKKVGLQLWRQRGVLADFPENASIYFLGYIRFEDGNGTTRSMGFCRLYRGSTERFTKVQDDDYEYAD